VRQQEYGRALDLALDLGRFYSTVAHDARVAGASMRSGDTIREGK